MNHILITFIFLFPVFFTNYSMEAEYKVWEKTFEGKKCTAQWDQIHIDYLFLTQTIIALNKGRIIDASLLLDNLKNSTNKESRSIAHFLLDQITGEQP